MKKYLSAIAAFIICFYGCENEPMNPGGYDAVITIIEPEDGEDFDSGDELHVEVTFVNTGGEIANVQVLVLNETTSDTLLFVDEHADVAEYYEVHEHFDLDVSEISQFKVYAATWDHDDEANKIESEIQFTVNP
ncbi:MAG: hypothetical protein H7Y00_14395 [Fimbriimonadaceae bacterium]|nr:hypothetical protein [Chitinophagales bacterium]